MNMEFLLCYPCFSVFIRVQKIGLRLKVALCSTHRIPTLV
jgi:hypothetical protein